MDKRKNDDRPRRSWRFYALIVGLILGIVGIIAFVVMDAIGQAICKTYVLSCYRGG